MVFIDKSTINGRKNPSFTLDFTGASEPWFFNTSQATRFSHVAVAPRFQHAAKPPSEDSRVKSVVRSQELEFIRRLGKHQPASGSWRYQAPHGG